MSTNQTRRPVLLAFDGSDHARRAIREAGRQLCGWRHAIVLTVWRPLSALPLTAEPVLARVDGLERSLEAEAYEVAVKGARLAASVGFAATALVDSGEPVSRAIIAAADEQDAALIVLGSHGRTGLRRLAMGSVASAVVRHTGRSVLVVHGSPADMARLDRAA